MKPMQPIRVLVTGATGFLGGNIVAALAASAAVDCVAACRSARRLPRAFDGEVRCGDLRDALYRRDVVQGVDVICHAGTWASMWNHGALERARFLLPTRDLIEQAIDAGVGRFVPASTVAIGRVRRDGQPHDDFSPSDAPASGRTSTT